MVDERLIRCEISQIAERIDITSAKSCIVTVPEEERESFRTNGRLDGSDSFGGPLYVPTTEIDLDRTPNYHGSRLYSVISEYGDQSFTGQAPLVISARQQYEQFPLQL
jgi:hypothetical protein